MKILNKIKFLASIVSISLAAFSLVFTSQAYAVTPPDRGLGAADSYAVFGKAGVTNDAGGTTHIWGNVGADLMTNITNLIASQVGGAIIAPATNVQTDASSTYNSLMSTLQGTSTPLDLAGTHTITPGVYDVAASTLNGALTLDGAGVYIFRSSSDVTTVASGTMNLIDGACASNVFWAIPASMTIGAGAHVEGTIIAQTGLISLGSGATLVGRAISLTKQVTLLLNQITQPICEVAATPTPTPTSSGPTPTPEGDHRSDNRSDNRSSTPQPAGNVLGATTSTLAATGSSDQSVRIMLAVTAALSVFLLGKVLLRANKTS
jgi:hypothetical protein